VLPVMRFLQVKSRSVMFSACDGGAVCLGLALLVCEVFLNFSGSNRCREPVFEDFSGNTLVDECC
jgi:hypothetical protein